MLQVQKCIQDILQVTTANFVIEILSERLQINVRCRHDAVKLFACLGRYVSSRHGNCFLLDRDFEPGDEPVKLCLRDGEIVEFHKQIDGVAFDTCGESIGFFRFEPAVAAAVLAAGQVHADAGRHDLWYEEAIRDVVLQAPDRFGCEDVTGLPWIEIDFPEDMRRAEREVLPRLKETAGA